MDRPSKGRIWTIIETLFFIGGRDIERQNLLRKERRNGNLESQDQENPN